MPRPQASPRTPIPSAFALRNSEAEKALRTGEQGGLLEDLLGEAGLAELRALARQAASASVRGGNRVLILPGIMGSTLGYPASILFDDALWIDPIDIARGRLIELKLTGGRPGEVQALGVLLFAYLALKLRLRIAGHDADFFPFDWRLGMAALGTRLVDELGRDARRTHLVAHSMGGLVARAALQNGVPENLGRVVTLGTPHDGSYSPVQAFRGVHSIVRRVAVLDLQHDQAGLAEIFATFPGLLEMIPSPSKRPLDLFDLANWPAAGSRPDRAVLQAAGKAQGKLVALDTLPPLQGLPGSRAVLVVGLGTETVVAARRSSGNGPDEFVYDLSDEGDGTVPLDLAQVPGLPTYVTTADHGGMPNSATVAGAVDNILSTGETALLRTLADATAEVRGRTRALRSVSDSQLAALGPPPEAVRGGISVREQRLLVEEFAAPPVASGTPGAARPTAVPGGAGRLAAASAGPLLPLAERALVVARRHHQRLEITLAQGSITEVDADAYVLGVFRSVAPTGAAAAVDVLLDNALAELVARRMVSGNIGEITALPVGRIRRVRTENILMAGLGTIDGYQDSVLEAVGESVMRTALLSRLNDFAIVPLGASAGTPPGESVTALIKGFVKALENAAEPVRMRGITICETDPVRFHEIRETFYRLLREPRFDGIEVILTETVLPPPAAQPDARGGPAPLGDRGPDPIYLLVREETNTAGASSVVASVLTPGGAAAIHRGRQPVDVDALNAHLAKVSDGSTAIGDIVAYGKALGAMVLEQGVREVLLRGSAAAPGTDAAPSPLIVVHDAATSRIPWEALHLDDGVAPALAGGLSHRYDGGLQSISKWIEGRADAPLNILLVVDPTEDLAGADREGDRIEQLVRDRLPSAQVRVLRGPQARRKELMDCFASGTYDVVHYAGHAFFDPLNRGRSGILCYGREVLSGADLTSLSRLPALVVFNACESARVRRGLDVDGTRVAETHVDEPVRGTVSFAESFLAGGIANYIGTYWPVGDAAAKVFAETFYGALLDGTTLGASLLAARHAVSRSPDSPGDWSDYALYGDPAFRLKTTDRARRGVASSSG